jgi:FAD/FMN-containing dehydrogenase
MGSRVRHSKFGDSKDENPELFWALRGGGGNFGVVTSFELALHAVGPMVNLGLFFFGLESGADALAFSRGFIPALPDEATGFLGISLSAPPAPFVPEQHRLRPGHALLVVGFGSPAEHASIVAPIRKAVTPLFELVTPIPFVTLQQMFNESAMWGSFGYEKALYLDELSAGAIAVIGEHAPKKSSPLSFVPTFALNGRYCDVPEAETAFGGRRSAGFVFNVAAAAPTRELYEADRVWVKNFWDAMRPYASGSGGYVNFMSEPEEDRVKASYGAEKYARLARVKAQWDSDNVFHLNANIKPT